MPFFKKSLKKKSHWTIITKKVIDHQDLFAFVPVKPQQFLTQTKDEDFHPHGDQSRLGLYVSCPL